MCMCTCVHMREVHVCIGGSEVGWLGARVHIELDEETDVGVVLS